MGKTVNQIADAIERKIEERMTVAIGAMETLEKLNTTPEDFKSACRLFETNCFISTYLRHIRSVVKKADIKTAENIMRYHAYSQRIKGNLEDGESVSGGQAAIAHILDEIIAEFF